MAHKKVGIIGCGNMGEALLSRLLKLPPEEITLMVSEADSARHSAMQAKYKILLTNDNSALVDFSDIIIIAVKPKDFEGLFKKMACSLKKEKLVISIAAGITTKRIETLARAEVPVVRVMPNMPAMIGDGISSVSAGRFANKGDVEIAKGIFSLLGDVVEVEEKLVDAVTAVSGSGPAYFFYFIECLVEAAKELGLDEKTAKRLVFKTALGSAKMFEALHDDPVLLRSKVTSKGGTTEAAFKVFESRDFRKVVKDAVKEAHCRSQELSQK